MGEIKIATIDKIIDIYNLCLEVKKTYSLWNDDYPTYEDFMYEYYNGLVLYYEDNGEIIGSLCIENGFEDFLNFDDTVSFNKFMVEPNHRKKGIGTKLFNEAEKIAKRKKIKRIVFLVHKDNINALSLYTKFGYENKGKMDVPWVDNINVYYYLFEKSI